MRRTAPLEVTPVAGFQLLRVTIGVAETATAVTQHAIVEKAILAGPRVRNASTDGVVCLVDGAGAGFVRATVVADGARLAGVRGAIAIENAAPAIAQVVPVGIGWAKPAFGQVTHGVVGSIDRPRANGLRTRARGVTDIALGRVVALAVWVDDATATMAEPCIGVRFRLTGPAGGRWCTRGEIVRVDLAGARTGVATAGAVAGLAMF